MAPSGWPARRSITSSHAERARRETAHTIEERILLSNGAGARHSRAKRLLTGVVMMKKLFATAATVVALAACSESDGSGKLTVQMTDAPFPFSEVSAVNVF